MHRRRPADWETPAAIWLAWPHDGKTWPGRFETIPGFYDSWVRRIAESTPVRLIADPSVAAQCERRFRGQHQIEIFAIPTNDVWVRDFGPQFVLETDDAGTDSLIAVDFRYNAWGGKYPPWDADAAAAKQIATCADVRYQPSPLCVEGGAMEFDGTGRMLTTPPCLLDSARNEAAWDKSKIAQHLHATLGVTEIVWVDGGGLPGDDTDGHIDQLARFLDPQNVIVATTPDRDRAEYESLRDNFRQVELWAASTSPTVNVHAIPLPPGREIDGQAVPQSYCNFLRLGPDRMLVPGFDDTTDDVAVGMLSQWTQANIEVVDCRDLVWGLGALHCASLEQPLL
ncbi:MAG: agmatine deiminase family protein [Planctomycetota bacterium]